MEGEKNALFIVLVDKHSYFCGLFNTQDRSLIEVWRTTRCQSLLLERKAFKTSLKRAVKLSPASQVLTVHAPRNELYQIAKGLCLTQAETGVEQALEIIDTKFTPLIRVPLEPYDPFSL